MRLRYAGAEGGVAESVRFPAGSRWTKIILASHATVSFPIRVRALPHAEIRTIAPFGYPTRESTMFEVDGVTMRSSTV